MTEAASVLGEWSLTVAGVCGLAEGPTGHARIVGDLVAIDGIVPKFVVRELLAIDGPDERTRTIHRLREEIDRAKVKANWGPDVDLENLDYWRGYLDALILVLDLLAPGEST